MMMKPIFKSVVWWKELEERSGPRTRDNQEHDIPLTTDWHLSKLNFSIKRDGKKASMARIREWIFNEDVPNYTMTRALLAREFSRFTRGFIERDLMYFDRIFSERAEVEFR